MLLKFAVQDFMEDREYKNLSPETIKIYYFALKDFQRFCSENEIVNAEDVTQNTIKKYLIHAKERGNKPATLNHKLNHLKTFFNYLTNELEVFTEKANPTKKVGYVRTDDKLEVYTDQQIRQMLAYYRNLKNREKAFYACRDYTMIITLMGSGIRLGELVNLTWANVDFVNSKITVYGKRRQYSSIPMFEMLQKELSDYKVYCEQNFGELNEYVFVDQTNKGLTENAVKCVFKRLAQVMGFRVNAHQFRHYFAKQFIMAGGDALVLQKMLRHSNLVTTQRYVNLWGTALASQNDQFNPLSRFKI